MSHFSISPESQENGIAYVEGLKDFMTIVFRFDKYFASKPKDDVDQSELFCLIYNIHKIRYNIEVFGHLAEVPYFIRELDFLKKLFYDRVDFHENFPSLLEIVEKYADLIVRTSQLGLEKSHTFKLYQSFQEFVLLYDSEFIQNQLKSHLCMFEVKYSVLKSKAMDGYLDYAHLLKKYAMVYSTLLKTEEMKIKLEKLENIRYLNESHAKFSQLNKFREILNDPMLRQRYLDEDYLRVVERYAEVLFLIKKCKWSPLETYLVTRPLIFEFYTFLGNYESSDYWEPMERLLAKTYRKCMEYL